MSRCFTACAVGSKKNVPVSSIVVSFVVAPKNYISVATHQRNAFLSLVFTQKLLVSTSFILQFRRQVCRENRPEAALFLSVKAVSVERIINPHDSSPSTTRLTSLAFVLWMHSTYTLSYCDFRIMPLTIPPELKRVTPYVRRAEELDRDKTNAESRLVAYYCRQYAVQLGIELATSVEGKTCLGELLSALEAEKEAMNSFNREEAKFLCRKFADKIFAKADFEDRTGDATKTTAKTFYASASFLEILQQFYKTEEEAASEELEEITKKAVYGKWKATEILKAIKEGRKPTPGGYGEDEKEDGDDAQTEDTAPTSNVVSGDETEETVAETVADDEKSAEEEEPPMEESVEVSTIRLPSPDDEDAEDGGQEEDSNGKNNLEFPPPAYDFSPPPMAPPVVPPSAPKPLITITPAAPAPAPVVPPLPAPKPAPAPTPKKLIFGFGKKKTKLSKADFADAMELTKFAMAALEDKHGDLAAERLEQALEVLNRHK